MDKKMNSPIWGTSYMRPPFIRRFFIICMAMSRPAARRWPVRGSGSKLLSELKLDEGFGADDVDDLDDKDDGTWYICFSDCLEIEEDW